MWKDVGLIAIGFLGANIINFIELGAILKVLKNSTKIMNSVEKMLRQFKEEGEDDEWLK